jgi:O-antigen ligase
MAFQPEGLDERQNSFPFKCLVFFTFVLLMAPQLMFPFLEPLHLARISSGLAIVAYVLNRLSRGLPLTVMLPEMRLVLWFVALAVVSIPLSLWPGGSWNTLLELFLKSVAIFFLIANVVDTIDRMKILIGSMALWGAVLSVTAIRNYVTGNLAVQGIRIAGYESPLTNNPNDLALTLNLILGLTLGLLLGSTSAVRRLLLLGAMGLFAAGIIVSFSRQGFLGLATIGIVYLARRVRKNGLIVLVVALALLVLVITVSPRGYGERLYSAFDTSLDVTGSATVRWELMKYAVVIMLSRPFGVGIGMNTLALREAGVATWTLIHNVYLQIGVELGLAGLLVFLLLAVRLFREIRRSLERLEGVPNARSLFLLGYGVQISLLSFLVMAMFAPVAYHFYFFYIAGLGVAFQVTARTIVEELPEQRQHKMPGHLKSSGQRTNEP